MDAATHPNVLLVGGPLHGKRLRVDRLPMVLVLAAIGASCSSRSQYIHQYELIEKDNSFHRHLVSVYAPAALPHPEVLRLAKLAAELNPFQASPQFNPGPGIRER